ncbi:hypothetical protein GCM10010168_78660 [Actinoplanes ianthinogenes]|nr:hypothetical protein GCM10010168_78660 [Actinoplanes ianthinogenes]
MRTPNAAPSPSPPSRGSPGGWVAAQGGWLDVTATKRAAEPLGRAEVTATLSRLRDLATRLDALLAALP